MLNTPQTFPEWARQKTYPTRAVLYGWTRPSERRDELLRAGVIVKVNGRWLFNPAKWVEYCTRQAA